ncbi:MAG: DUF1364 family protein [Acinetobacter sp.]|nr:DUF1364 family protein [Acinetobacter sp.]
MSKSNRTSEYLRQFAKGQPCTLRVAGVCVDDSSHETTVMCHLPVGMKGVGMKVNDLYSIHACHACHDVLDRRRKGVEVDSDDLLKALCRTMDQRLKAGLIKVKGMAE